MTEKKKKRKKSKSFSRTKGHSFERDIAARFRTVFPNAIRELEYQKSKAVGVDLANTGPYLVQCKRFKKYAPISCIEEIRARDVNEIPVLVTKANNQPTLAVIPFEHFIKLLELESMFNDYRVAAGLCDWEDDA